MRGSLSLVYVTSLILAAVMAGVSLPGDDVDDRFADIYGTVFAHE